MIYYIILSTHLLKKKLSKIWLYIYYTLIDIKYETIALKIKKKMMKDLKLRASSFLT